jgi:hypothetical protein
VSKVQINSLVQPMQSVEVLRLWELQSGLMDYAHEPCVGQGSLLIRGHAATGVCCLGGELSVNEKSPGCCMP